MSSVVVPPGYEAIQDGRLLLCMVHTVLWLDCVHNEILFGWFVVDINCPILETLIAHLYVFCLHHVDYYLTQSVVFTVSIRFKSTYLVVVVYNFLCTFIILLRIKALSVSPKHVRSPVISG